MIARELQSPLWRILLDLGRQRIPPRSLTPGDAKALIELAWHNVELTVNADRPSGGAFLRLRNLAAIESLFATGMRVGELVRLNVADWNEQERTFLINGKGSRQRIGFYPTNGR